MSICKVAVLGAGAIGTLVGGCLARAGHDVVFVTREGTVPTLIERGVTVRSGLYGEFSAKVRATARLTEAVDVCVIAVKQPALSNALNRLSDASMRDAMIVPLLNGVEHIDELRDRFRESVIAAGVIRVEANLTDVGIVEHGSPFAKVDIASAEVNGDRLSAFSVSLEEAGFDSSVASNEEALLWGKLAVLAPFSLVTTRYAVTIGEALESHRAEIEALLAEANAVAVTKGCADLHESALRFYASFPHEAKSSMQRDAEAGRPLEVNAIGGAVARAAALSGIRTPVTREFVAALSA